MLLIGNNKLSKTSFQGQEADEARTACVDCVAGKFQSSVDGGACQDCEAGSYSTAKSSECTKCSPVSKGVLILLASRGSLGFPVYKKYMIIIYQIKINLSSVTFVSFFHSLFINQQILRETTKKIQDRVPAISVNRLVLIS